MTKSYFILRGNCKENGPSNTKELRSSLKGPLRSISLNKPLNSNSATYNFRIATQNGKISKENQTKSNKKVINITNRKKNTKINTREERYLDSKRFKDLNVSDEWLSSKEKKNLYNTIRKETHDFNQKETEKQYYNTKSNNNALLDRNELNHDTKQTNIHVVFTPNIEKNRLVKNTENSGELRKKNKDQFLLEKQLEKLLILDSLNSQSEMPPEKSSLIYEPLHISDTNKTDFFAKDSVKLKLTHFDHKLKNLRKQLDFFDTLNKQKHAKTENLNAEYTYVIDYINQKNQIEKINQFNHLATKKWYSNKKIEINNDYDLECKNLQSEFEIKKDKLKETFLQEQKEDNLRCQASISKIEIDSPTKETSKLDETKSQTNKPANSNHSITKTPIFTTNLLTRSKKRLVVPKLRPRLNGRASVAPLDLSTKNKKNHFCYSIPNQASSETRIYINKKSKPTSIENRLKIKFTLQQEEINDDLNFLNNNLQYSL